MASRQGSTSIFKVFRHVSSLSLRTTVTCPLCLHDPVRNLSLSSLPPSIPNNSNSSEPCQSPSSLPNTLKTLIFSKGPRKPFLHSLPSPLFLQTFSTGATSSSDEKNLNPSAPPESSPPPPPPSPPQDSSSTEDDVSALYSDLVIVSPDATSPDVKSPDVTSPAKKTPKVSKAARFYKKTSAEKAEGEGEGGHGGWVVKLDHRVLKTPAKKDLIVPTEAMALAIAAEWEWQEGRQLRPYTMPLMKLATTTIDQVPFDREGIIESLLKYFHSDTVCCRSQNPLLAIQQTQEWDPLLDWVESQIGARPTSSSDLFVPDQPEKVLEAMGRALEATNDWELSAIDSLAGTARSLVVALAIARERLGPSEAIKIIRLEEDFQVESWGFVEGGHDIDIADLRVRISAPSVFLRFLELK